MFQDTQATITKLGALREGGVRIAVDDFGTGYSSLGYLRQFPVDILKIARDFVVPADRPDDEWAFAHAIVALGQTLGLQIVAEGIEEAGQVERLLALGCAYGQGYHFARPMNARELAVSLGFERRCRDRRDRGVRSPRALGDATERRVGGLDRRAGDGHLMFLLYALRRRRRRRVPAGRAALRTRDARVPLGAAGAAGAGGPAGPVLGPVSDRVGDLGPWIYVASTAMVLAFVLRNLRITGLPIVAIGAASNLAAIVANGGYMPASPEAAAAPAGTRRRPTRTARSSTTPSSRR